MPTRLFFGFLLFWLLVIAPGKAAALEPPRSGHPVFDRAVQLVVDNFYDGSALDRFAEAVRNEIHDPDEPLNGESPQGRVDEAIATVLASLEASHTGHFRRDTIDYFELVDIFRYAIGREMRRLFPRDGEVSYAGIGMIARQFNGLWFVADVYHGSPAERAGILVGDEILAVDGAPYHEIESFRSKVGRDAKIRLRRHAGAAPIEVEAKVESLRPLRSFERAIENSAAIFERDGRKIGYVRIWTLAARNSMDIVAEAVAAGQLKDAEGLVLDLRGRWGGGQADAAELFLGDTPEFRLIPRKGKPELANVRWRKPVVAIIDEGSRSGLELFAYALKTNGTPLVGTRTAGALLAGRAFLLPDDSLLEIAVLDAVVGEGVRLEGVGVTPDITVLFDLPYAAGRDPQRDAAVEEMLRILTQG